VDLGAPPGARRRLDGPGDVVRARPGIRWTTLTIDCADAEELGAFYSRLFGWEIVDRDGAGWLQLRNPDGGIGLNIQSEDGYEPPVWPEQPGRQAKMMHLEVLVEDLEAAVQEVLAAGGSEAAHQPPDRDRTRLRIMLDPAGHPFCLFVAGE
jgi:catechol 2,3-dioxygenase-like lactoylglutathione lyase family enzyme